MIRAAPQGLSRREAYRHGSPRWRWAVFPGLPLLLSACLAHTPETPQCFDFRAHYAGAPGRAAILLDNVVWWRGLNDPVFTALGRRALTENLDIRHAAERVEEARTAARAAMPATTLSPSAQTGAQTTNNASAGANISLAWLLDPWGGRRAQARAAQEELAAARLIMLDNLGLAYIDLRYRQRLLALGEEDLRLRRRVLSTTRDLAARDRATQVETSRAAARVAAQEGALPQLRAAVVAAATAACDRKQSG